MTYTFTAERPGAQEVYDLFVAIGWPVESARTIKKSLSAYPCKICARTETGDLVGYASVFSDEVMTTMLGELIVHPQHRRAGVGTGMMTLLESIYPNAPVYVKALGESKLFYAHLGFKAPNAEMTVLFKKPWQGADRRCPGG
jgi:predicted N-acetyltransferase YhbS